jgi:ribosomal-protein-alanine N-acetyltransferase
MEMFSTERLRLRTWRDEDFDSLYAILSDPVTMSHWPQPLDRKATRAWLDRSLEGMQEHGYARWCCERLADNQIVGDVGIVRMELEGEWINDLGYIIQHDYWRQGYALEAAQGAMAWALNRQLDKLVATMATDNLPSVAVAEKLKMQRKRDFIKANDADKATYWYELNLDA